MRYIGKDRDENTWISCVSPRHRFRVSNKLNEGREIDKLISQSWVQDMGRGRSRKCLNSSLANRARANEAIEQIVPAVFGTTFSSEGRIQA